MSRRGHFNTYDSFETKIEGQLVEVSFRRLVDWCETTEGEDADGRRGYPVTEVDDQEFDQVEVIFEADNKVSKLEDLRADLRNRIVGEIEQYVEEHPAEYNPPDEPEYESELELERRERYYSSL